MDVAHSISVRTATIADLAYVVSLQDKFTHEVGCLPTGAIQGYIERHYVSLAHVNGEPAAYLLGRDTSRFDPSVGRIYQAAVQMDARHIDVGRALVAQYCSDMPEACASILLFCAQDIEANMFWETLGFRAVGYREGSRQKGRIHIAWQRSTRPDEDPLFVSIPDSTSGGMLRDQRIVLPLAPHQTWRDVKLHPSQKLAPVRFPEKPTRVPRGRRSRHSNEPIFVIPANHLAIVRGGKIHYVKKSSALP